MASLAACLYVGLLGGSDGENLISNVEPYTSAFNCWQSINIVFEQRYDHIWGLHNTYAVPRLKFLVANCQRVPVTVGSLAHEDTMQLFWPPFDGEHEVFWLTGEKKWHKLTNFFQRVDDIININILDFRNVRACVRACVCTCDWVRACARARVLLYSAEQWSVFVCSAVCVCLCVCGVVCVYIHLTVYFLLTLMSIETTDNTRMYFPTQL